MDAREYANPTINGGTVKRKKLEPDVGEITHAASDAGRDALAQALAYLQLAQEYLAPRAEDAYRSARSYALDARKKAATWAAAGVDAARPRIDEALDRVGPAVDDAYQRVAPVIDNARSKVQHDFLPWLSDALHEAAETTSRIELPEVPMPEVAAPPKRRSAWRTFGKILLAGGLLAAAAYAVRAFLAPSDAGWQAHEPSSPYVPTTSETLVDDLSEDVEETADAADAIIDEEVAEEAASGDDAAEDDADPFVASPYGEGSYVGTNPPEGFDIKGNERSMKYHVFGNGGYQRTIADVWFNSEAAAVAAGFTKAQR